MMRKVNKKGVIIGCLAFLTFAACSAGKDTEQGMTQQPDTVTSAVVSPTVPAPTAVVTETPIPTVTQTPAEVPSAEETPAPESAGTPTDLPSTVPTAAPTPAVTVDDFNAADFFDGAVFSGDSVMSHFYWKVPYKDKETFGKSQFLVAVSYSVREALKPVSETSIHPMYKGEQRPIWESMKLMEAKRVILFYGLNDIGINGVDGFLKNYKKLISNIKAELPEVKVYIISTTPMRADMEKDILNNENIALADEKLKEYCAEEGLGYIDIASHLMDETGALQERYSDGTNVHQTIEAYELWKELLVKYAKEQLLEEYIKTQE